MRHRSDHNQAAIIEGLRGLGASVAVLAQLGGGVPDLLVGFRGQNYLFEVKNKRGRGCRLTPAESEFAANWRGQLATITDLDEALVIMGIAP